MATSYLRPAAALSRSICKTRSMMDWFPAESLTPAMFAAESAIAGGDLDLDLDLLRRVSGSSLLF